MIGPNRSDCPFVALRSTHRTTVRRFWHGLGSTLARPMTRVGSFFFFFFFLGGGGGGGKIKGCGRRRGGGGGSFFRCHYHHFNIKFQTNINHVFLVSPTFSYLIGLWIQYLDIFHRVKTATGLNYFECSNEIIVDFHELKICIPIFSEYQMQWPIKLSRNI